MSDKAAERTQLVLTFGRLLAPLHALASAPTPPAPQEYQVAAARLNVDLQKWRPTVQRFATIGGVEFGQELDDILRPLGDLPRTITKAVSVNNIYRNVMWPDSIVPFAMEGVWIESYLRNLGIGDLASHGVATPIQAAGHRQSLRRGGLGD